MVKKLLSIFALAASTVGFSQIHFSENFNTGLGSWIVVDGDSDPAPATGTNFDVWYDADFSSYDASLGAKSAVSRSWASNVVYHPNNFLTSPSINLTGVAAAGLKLSFTIGTIEGAPFQAEHYAVYVSTASDTTSILATTPVFEETISLGASFHAKLIDLSAYAGQTIYLTFRHFNTTDMNTLILDNIAVKTIPSFDMSVTEISTPAYVATASTSVTGVITNLGYTAINSFTLNYSMNNGPTVSTPITGVNIATNGTYNYTHPTAAALPNATNTLKVWATDLNGTNVDANTSNDEMTKTISKVAEAVQRVPLLEVFTSSTCAPCNPGNANFLSVMNPAPKMEYVAAKYQQDFPGTGDPYNTVETLDRRAYYAINSIPRMEIDGGWDGNASSYTTALYNAAKAVPAFFKLEGTYTRNPANTMAMKVKFSPLVDPTGSKLYVAIIENRTVQNVKTNGETEFFDVVKKMVPTQNGTAIPATAISAWDSLSFNYTFPGTFRLPATGQTANIINLATEHSVENFANLYAVAWVQNADKTVMQACRLTSLNSLSTEEMGQAMTEVSVYPNPSNSALTFTYQTENPSDMKYVLVDLVGNVVWNSNEVSQIGLNKVQINTSTLGSGMYNLMIFDGKNNASVESVSIQH